MLLNCSTSCGIKFHHASVILCLGENVPEAAVCCFRDIPASRGQQNLELLPAAYGKELQNGAGHYFGQERGAFTAVSLGENLGPGIGHIIVCFFES